MVINNVIIVAVVISRCSFPSHHHLVCINQKQSEG
ncbi:unnamed protein product [Onchocerca flexuosa]|uniref:Uncharacterized protein n=1 Tax=Onchocerca flexuosa TaxID=387005 RepID=A0A183HWI4_9BILA|nr:unnamed protein product [Onchocerca flexuosa]